MGRGSTGGARRGRSPVRSPERVRRWMFGSQPRPGGNAVRTGPGRCVMFRSGVLGRVWGCQRGRSDVYTRTMLCRRSRLPPRYHRDRHPRAGGVGHFSLVPISRPFEGRAEVAPRRDMQPIGVGRQHEPLDRSADGQRGRIPFGRLLQRFRETRHLPGADPGDIRMDVRDIRGNGCKNCQWRRDCAPAQPPRPVRDGRDVASTAPDPRSTAKGLPSQPTGTLLGE